MSTAIVFNPYVFNKRGAELAAWLAGQMPDRDDVAFGSETYHLRDDLASVGHVYAGKKGGGREVAVITRRRADEHATVQLTVDRGNKVWKDRWFTRTRTGDQVEYSFHANAVIQNRVTKRWRRNKGARDWRAGLSLLRDLMKRDIDAGLAVRCGGDGNWRRTKKAVPRSIQAVFEQLGMKYVNVELMWLAWTPKQYRMVDLDVLPTPPGADGHPVIRAEFTRRDQETPAPTPAPGPVQPPAPPYLGPAKFYSKGGNKPIRRITLHGTVSPTVRGGARTIAQYFRTTVTRPSSAHYVVDPYEEFQVVLDSDVAYHAPPNPGSLGLEFCDLVEGPITRWDDEPHRLMFDRGARLVARLCLAYGIPIRMIGPIRLRLGWRGISDHDDVSKAWGQTSHWDLGAFPRRRFKRAVKRHAKRIRSLHTQLRKANDD